MEEFLYGTKLCVGHSFPLIDSSRLLFFFQPAFQFCTVCYQHVMGSTCNLFYNGNLINRVNKIWSFSLLCAIFCRNLKVFYICEKRFDVFLQCFRKITRT